jgi:hypothetical protein
MNILIVDDYLTQLETLRRGLRNKTSRLTRLIKLMINYRCYAVQVSNSLGILSVPGIAPSVLPIFAITDLLRNRSDKRSV